MSLLKPTTPRIYHRRGAPVAWFLMDSPRRTFPGDSGDVADLAGNSAGGVRSGGATWATGPHGACLSFSAASSGNVASPGPVFPAHSPITVSYRQYVAGTPPTSNEAFTVGNTSNPQVRAYSPYTDGTLYFDYGNGFGGRISADYSAHYGKWTHVVLQGAGLSQDWLAIYFDGKLAASSTSSGEPPTVAPSGVVIGAAPYDSSYFTGSISDFRIYDYIISPAEVAREYADPYWRLRPSRRVATFAMAPAPTYTYGPAALLTGI